MIHELKCERQYFEALINGSKTFEVRRNDRNFKVGDVLRLEEIIADGKNGIQVTGNTADFIVMYILDEKKYCMPGFVIMSIQKI